MQHTKTNNKMLTGFVILVIIGLLIYMGYEKYEGNDPALTPKKSGCPSCPSPSCPTASCPTPVDTNWDPQAPDAHSYKKRHDYCLQKFGDTVDGPVYPVTGDIMQDACGANTCSDHTGNTFNTTVCGDKDQPFVCCGQDTKKTLSLIGKGAYCSWINGAPGTAAYLLSNKGKGYSNGCNKDSHCPGKTDWVMCNAPTEWTTQADKDAGRTWGCCKPPPVE